MTIIQATVGIVDIAAVAEGVGVEPLVVGAVEDVAPGVVAVDAVGSAGAVDQPHHIALSVQHIVYGLAVVLHGVGIAVVVIEEPEHQIVYVHPHQLAPGIVVGVLHAVHRLRGSKPAGVVAVADAGGAVGGGSQLPPVLPGEGPPRPVVVAGGVAAGSASIFEEQKRARNSHLRKYCQQNL